MALEEWLHRADLVLATSAVILELLAAAVIVFGVILGLYRFIHGLIRHRHGGRGRVTLLGDVIFGLDVLVAADILLTATDPTLRELGRLGGIVTIRIVLTFVLTREMEEVKDVAADHGDDQPPTRSAKSDAPM